MDMKDEIMILVRDAVKSYNSKNVLRSLSLSVKKHSIYGLLGPSSCGKTTLLNCILGVKRLDSGFINLKVNSSKEIGYMPQELALFENFTLEETYSFFGNFFGLPEKTMKYRMNDLQEFLWLKDCNSRLISTFSGGQKRRVSFAIALLHDPTLLILDEPTVGMDCVLSERIWQYLIKLSEQGKTIIITTHYIQEANNCHTIGLMRYGELLEEKSPAELMAIHQTSNLEEIFLQVCKKQDNEDNATNKTVLPASSHKEATYRLFPENTWFDKYRFKALLNKNVLWLRRNPLAASGLAFLPVLLAVLYGMIMGQNPKSLQVGMLSEEFPIGEGLKPCSNASVIYNEELKCYLPQFLSCTFIDELKNRDIHVVPYAEYDYMIEDIISNKVWASIEVPRNFTSSLIARIEDGMRTPWDLVDSSVLTARVDGANSIIKLLITKHFISSVEDMYNDILISCGMSEKAQIIPIQFNDPVFGKNEAAYDECTLPGFLSAFAFYLTLIYTTSAIMMEKVLGLIDRNTAAGMTYVEVVLAHLTVQFVVMFVQNFILLMIFYEFLGYAMEGSSALIMFLLLTVNAVGISFGFLLTEIFTKELSTAYASIGATVSVFTTGGIIWPEEGMNYFLACLQTYLPVSPLTKTLTSVIIRGYNLFHPLVIKGLVSNIFWVTVFTVLAFTVHRINKKL